MRNTIAALDSRRAYAVLRGLTGHGGGMVAAATTSLPERPETGRNYDYRYVWIRDQSYAGQAAASAGAHDLLDAAVRFVSERLLADGTRLAPAYTVHGDTAPRQRELDLPGYPGGFSRIGNHISEQFQLDCFGGALLLFAGAQRADRLSADAFKAADVAVRAIAERWREPDAGIWELEARSWIHSRLTCVAGLRALAGTAGHRPLTDTCTQLADTLLADTSVNCSHRGGHWQRAPDDPRTRATLAACRDQLAQDHLLYRFRHDARPLGEAEGAFLMCGFVMAMAEHQQGHAINAHRWFERARGACGASGLYAEEFDIAQRQLRGNLPQGFVHALLLNSAAHLAHN
ncbi:glycoside hydrolase family 15 protein [Streptomyces sp. NPDC094038]|uniref:glycoside hydrolase family 15 protein n=1 Tax=Streptomyces sp. NPDC094038 TaxID=3366055 RepID=UPI003800D373